VYLSGKTETGGNSHALPTRRLVHNRTPASGRILLVLPPSRVPTGTVKRSIPPLGLAYIAASLRAAQLQCSILDCVVEGWETERQVGADSCEYGLDDASFTQRLLDHKPGLIGISVLYSSDLEAAYRLARISKTVLPSVLVVLGGLHPSIYPEETLRDTTAGRFHAVDYVIRGEGELRFARFATEWTRGSVDLGQDGLAGWADDELFINPQLETISELDRLPFPAYDTLPMQRYFDINVPFSPYPAGNRVMQIYTSRGCPIACTFCASTQFNRQHRLRSVANVMEEIDRYREQYCIDELQFADDNLTMNRSRAMELFQALRKRHLRWCTPNGIMVNSLTPELVDAMADSGMYQITLSIDSGSDNTLRERHHKPVRLGRIAGLIGQLHQRGVLVHGTLVVGMPGETIDDIHEGFAFVMSLPFDSVAVFAAQAIPGSELFEQAVSSGTMSRAQGRIIDTSRDTGGISNMGSSLLAELIGRFLAEFNIRAKARDPTSWERKYGAHLGRLRHMCVGKPGPNVSAILEASGC
jgi:phosphonoacetaldehyde methylase